ncbi:MAG: hypothetical protein JJ913_02525 [Rhizobiaceae bacterium]|nr:hypothetical protein [Rhizobiaceae bacterium]
MIEISPGLVALIKLGTDLLSKAKLPALSTTTTVTQAALERHFRLIENWSASIGLEGFIDGQKNTDSLSIPLQARLGARRWRNYQRQDREIADIEENIIQQGASALLLGDPGSGKSTTVKRILRSYIYPDIYKIDIEKSKTHFPLLIRVRSMVTENLFCEICHILDIHYDVVTDKRGEVVNDKTGKPQYHVNNMEIGHFVVDLIESMSVIICVDGIDEVSFDLKSRIFSDISFIALRVRSAAILATCRSGDVNLAPEGVEIFEILPLTRDQVRDITNIWLDNPNRFLDQMNEKLLSDVASRPLFLIQLIIIFDEYGDLPQQSIHIQDRLLSLMMTAWDKKRGVHRETKYAKFLPEIKLRFLADFAFWLLYKAAQKKSFSKRDIGEFYKIFAPKYELPINESDQVISEIESHTGIINMVSENLYEFSHLSIHEHLAARVVSASRNIRYIGQYFVYYSPPVAISISLSQKPSEELFSVLNRMVEHTFTGDANDLPDIRVFFRRLHIESPFFEPGLELAVSACFLLFHCADPTDTIMEKTCLEFCRRDSVRASLGQLFQSDKVRTADISCPNGKESHYIYEINYRDLSPDDYRVFSSSLLAGKNSISLQTRFFYS